MTPYGVIFMRSEKLEVGYKRRCNKKLSLFEILRLQNSFGIFPLRMTIPLVIFLITVPKALKENQTRFSTTYIGVWGIPKRFKGVKGSGFRVRI